MLTALYVDDEPALLDVVKRFLEKTGNFSVYVAESAKEALTILSNHKIDIIISDYEMPVMNGIELLTEIRKAGFFTPFIIYTGRGRMEVVIQALEAGADSYIQKDGPIKNQIKELQGKIQKVVRWKIAEDEIKRKNREWEGIFQSIGESVLIIDPDYRIISANNAACILFGMDEGDIIGENCQILFHGGDAPEISPLSRSNSTKTCESGEIFSETLSKTFIVACTPILDETGKVEKFIHISTDITIHKQVEKELKTYREHLEELVRNRTNELITAKEEAESANKAKSTFLSNMSHELRTPLNAILGYTQLLSRNKNLTDIQKEQLKTVNTSGKHLLALINDLLDLSKIEAHVVKFEEKPICLTELFRDVYNITKVKANEKKLAFTYRKTSNIPDYVLGDEGKIKQILINLLNNAVKYTQKGGILFQVSYDFSDTHMLRCEISDSGIGIAADAVDEIFKPFTQLGYKGVPIEGTGLGLAITKSLVEFMKGTIELQSVPGEGSIFTIKIPLQMTYAVIPQEKTRNDITGYEGPRRKVLVVDDNPSNAHLLESLLAPLGFLVYTEDNGSDALEQVRLLYPDLLLLDLVMTGMDGLNVLKKIRGFDDLSDLKIIGLSAAVSRSDLKYEFKGACDAFLEKPINIDLLLEKIGSQLDLTWTVNQTDAGITFNERRTGSETTSFIPGEVDLKRIELTARQGNFKKIHAILREIEGTECVFEEFCQKIRHYSNKFDDDSILSYIKEIRGDRDGRKH